jgi:cytochrome c peroxidase
VSDSAKRGFALFTGKAKCDTCHQGYKFSDDGFHNIGLKTPDGLAEDIGRFAHRKVAVLKGAFKTPTLRDIALTAPYMHNGIYATLEEVVDYYDRGGDVKENLDLNMSALSLSNQEKIDLVNFLKSLTGKPVEISVPRLPQ